MGAEEGGSRGRLSAFLQGSKGWGRKKPRRKQAGEVCPPSRARNQVREPRRRRHAPAPAQDTRGKGTRSRTDKEEP